VFAVGAWVPASQLAEKEVAAFRKLEEDKASKALDDLLRICKTQGVRCTTNSLTSSIFIPHSIVTIFSSPPVCRPVDW
jgi:hypothetical protein